MAVNYNAKNDTNANRGSVSKPNKNPKFSDDGMEEHLTFANDERAREYIEAMGSHANAGMKVRRKSPKGEYPEGSIGDKQVITLRPPRQQKTTPEGGTAYGRFPERPYAKYDKKAFDIAWSMMTKIID